MFRLAFSCSAVGLLAACGGGSVSNQEFVDSLLDDAAAAEAAFIDGQDVLPLADLDEPGTATYTGYLAAFGGTGDPAIDTEEYLVGYIGELELTADFDNESISGTADNFANVENQEVVTEDADPVIGEDVTGTLSFTGELSTGTEAVFELSASGELEGPGGSFLDFNEVGGAADIYGANAEVLEVVGGTNTVTFDNQPGFLGYFGIVEK